MSRIESLTPEQEAMLLDVRDEWIAYGLSTEPADRETAERGVDEAYKAAGLKPPSVKLWLRSPLEGAIAAVQVRAQVGDQVDQVWDQVRDQVWAQVWDQVRAQVRAQVGDQVGDQVRAQVGRALWGQHDTWLSFYDCFDRLGVTACQHLRGLCAVARSAGWWWALKDLAVLTERHNRLIRDEAGRLHCTDGPALSYPDGCSVYAAHGVRISGDWIEKPETITAELINSHDNAEVSRVLLGLYGEERYLREIGAQSVASDTDALGQPRTLYRAQVPWSTEPLCMVRVINSTPEQDGSLKPYFLRVPPDIQTPHDAVAWTFGVDAPSYQPEIET